ncbi:MAG: hypothetical protein BMS9Abin05_0138 [Rhodothermia bacterium]|nr:MAG: hypothetical protein BMS9Abin05_0138 [Rhodothermia bacterium]
MKSTRSIGFALMLILATSGVSACTSSKDLASKDLASKSVSAEDSKATDIAWLTKSLQKEGVFITERGFPNLSVSAVTSSRLYLNNREILDVYGFDRVGDAKSNAYTLANMNPQLDVYRKESLVVVRYSNRDSGLNQILFQLLGVAL